MLPSSSLHNHQSSINATFNTRYCELRVVRGDDFWLSQYTTASGGDTLALAFGMNKCDPAAVMAAAATLESELTEFSPRPHWGKIHTMAPKHVASL